MTRMVSFLPTLPATADLLTPKVIDMVGCSTVIGSSGLGSLRSTTVSPMLKFSMPAKVTMSPAEASSTGVLPMASKAKSSVTLTLSTLQPGPALSPTCRGAEARWCGGAQGWGGAEARRRGGAEARRCGGAEAHLLRPANHARADAADAEPADEVVVGDV